MGTFRPPTVNDVPAVLAPGVGDAAARRLFRHFAPSARGRWVLKIGGTYATYDAPTQDEVDSASEVYMGGHVYVLSAAAETALIAAGYGAYIT